MSVQEAREVWLRACRLHEEVQATRASCEYGVLLAQQAKAVADEAFILISRNMQ